MNPHAERGRVLLQQGRHELAENEFRQALVAEPDDAYSHALLACCLRVREQHAEAVAEAREAVRLAADNSFCHYMLAYALDGAEKLAEAEASIREAIQLDPNDADYYALLSGLHIQRGRWREALEAADQGLALDAEHTQCTNRRAMALVKLGRRAEAQAAMEGALARDPDDAVTHANQGWALLHANNPKAALEHFREALRLEPDMEWARQGIVTALKAHNPIYRLMLAYSLWMSRLGSKVQWVVIIGLYFSFRLLQTLEKENPAWRPVLLPLLILFVAFAVLTWLANPIFNLLLRLNRFGRLALSRTEIIGSNFVGGFLLTALLALAVWFWTNQGYWLLVSVFSALMAIPVAATFSERHARKRTVLGGLTLALFLLCLTALLMLRWRLEPGSTLALIYLLGIAGFQWIAIALSLRRPG